MPPFWPLLLPSDRKKRDHSLMRCSFIIDDCMKERVPELLLLDINNVHGFSLFNWTLEETTKNEHFLEPITIQNYHFLVTFAPFYTKIGPRCPKLSLKRSKLYFSTPDVSKL